MPAIHSDSCPICKSNNLNNYLTCNDYLVSKQDFSLCKCPNCGFAFTQDFPSEDEIGVYYDAPEYISHSDTHQGIISKLYHIARKQALKSKGNIISKYACKGTNSLLDIGSGTGYFLNHMKGLQWKVRGIEKSESARELARKTFSIEAEDSDQLFSIPPKSADVITMWHVLEHMEHLNEVMDTLHSILKDDGTVFIALPNKQSSDARYYKKDWAAYDVPRHLWHFSPDDFELLAKNHGFKLTAIKPMYFDAFYIAMLSEKNRKTSLSSLIGLTKGGFFFLSSFFDVQKCSSVIYILKKQ